MEKTLMCATMYDFVIGGVPTYFVRMLSWAQKNGYSCYLLIHKERKIDEIWRDSLEKSNIEIMRYDFSALGINLLCDSNLKSRIFKSDINVITPELHCYLHFKACKDFRHANIVFYLLHPAFTKVTEIKLINYLYRNFLEKSINNGMIFMDLETETAYLKYYKSKKHAYKYYRIGDNIPSLKEESILNRTQKRKEKVVILAVARLEFPFKGYILGLVDNIEKLAKNNCDFELQIIGDGRDYEQLLKKIEKLPYELQKKIDFKGFVSYDLLSNYYENATVFVGMGTTLIEASKVGVPSIIATAFQNDISSVGYMYEAGDNVGGNLELHDGNKKSIVDLIENIMMMSDEEYIEISKACYKEVSVKYNLEKIMKEILEIKASEVVNCKIISIIDYVLVKLKFIVQKRRERRRK